VQQGQLIEEAKVPSNFFSRSAGPGIHRDKEMTSR
jgi:hypothetical protein